MKIDNIPFNEINSLVITHKKCFFILFCCYSLPILMISSSVINNIFEQNLLLATQFGTKDLTVNTKFLVFFKTFCLNDISASQFEIVTIVPLKSFQNRFNVLHRSTKDFGFARTFAKFAVFTNKMAILAGITIFPHSGWTRNILA